MSKQSSVVGTPIEQATRVFFTKIMAGLARTLRDEELTIAQIAALHLVDQARAMRMTELSEAVGLSPSAASRMIETLVQRDLLERTEDPNDRRARMLSLTTSGRAFLDRISEERVNVILETTKSFPANLTTKAMSIIARIGARIDKGRER